MGGQYSIKLTGEYNYDVNWTALHFQNFSFFYL
jgi:hypothetical protein